MKNYTGAEIEAVVKSANSFALNRHHNLLDFKTEIKFDTPGTVAMVDFEKALKEVRPEFGVEQSKLDIFLQEPLVNYGQRHDKIVKDISKLSEQVKSGKIKLASIALLGKRGTGKSSIAALMAQNSGFPFVKFVSSEDMVGTSLPFKIQYVVKAFEDAYKSTQSIVILDDLERLVEYVEIGRRFNNDLLQALLVLISKLPEKKDSSILIIATCSN
jgi:vesicle-fusing ATPase